MNRPYTYNRDRGKCKICNGYVEPNKVHVHHVDPKLPWDKVNKVKNLITTHIYCHQLIHNDTVPEKLSEETLERLTKYRKKIEKI